MKSAEYYKVVGSIVPALLLAIVFERRQEYWRTNNFTERFLVVSNIFGLVIAGGVVLRVLAEDDPGRGDARLAMAPIIFTLVSLLLALVARPEQEADQPAA